MGFLDKVREQAQQAVLQAQQGVAQGQAKLGEMQDRRTADALLRDLGAAYYAEQRSAGGLAAVTSALAAVDAHAAAHGPIDTRPSAPPAGADPAAPNAAAGGAEPGATRGAAPTGGGKPTGGPPPGAPPGPPAGNFSLDDL